MKRDMSKYKVIKKSSSLAHDYVDMANEMFEDGYRLLQIVPVFLLDGSPIGYTYWFEKID